MRKREFQKKIFGSIERILQIRPVEKAAVPIVEHNLDLIDAVCLVRPWYLGKCAKTPDEVFSRLLDPTCNSGCQKLDTFVNAILDFQPGTFPAHGPTVRQLQFTTRLLWELDATIESPVVKSAFYCTVLHLGDRAEFRTIGENRRKNEASRLSACRRGRRDHLLAAQHPPSPNSRRGAHHAILAAPGITAGIYRRRFCDILRVLGLSSLLLGHAGDALPDEASVLPEEGARLRGADEAESPSPVPDSA